MVKKNDIIEVNISDIEFPSKGVCLVESAKLYVKNSLPGQKLSVKIQKTKKSFEGRTEEVLKRAEYEISPQCTRFGLYDCGGCVFQNIEYSKEIELKEEMALKLIKEAGIKIGSYEGISCSPKQDSYRNKMEFAFGDDGPDGNLTLGMRRRGTYYETVNADICQICDTDVRKIVRTVLDFFTDKNEKFYHRVRKTGTLRHLVVRRAEFTGEILVTLVTTSTFETNLSEYVEALLALELKGQISGLLHVICDSVADVIKPEKIISLWGRSFITENLLGLKFNISPFSFFQTNSAGAEKLYLIVKDFAGDLSNKKVFDLYCGTGTIAQIVASEAKSVFGIEIVEEAVEAAKENAKLNNIDKCIFLAGDVFKVIDELKDKPDLIIVDPPREGIQLKSLAKIIDYKAEEIIYVSCNPVTLAKDLMIFEENGYIVKRLKFHDMFPRTNHVETCVLLSRKN